MTNFAGKHHYLLIPAKQVLNHEPNLLEHCKYSVYKQHTDTGEMWKNIWFLSASLCCFFPSPLHIHGFHYFRTISLCFFTFRSRSTRSRLQFTLRPYLLHSLSPPKSVGYYFHHQTEAAWITTPASRHRRRHQFGSRK